MRARLTLPAMILLAVVACGGQRSLNVATTSASLTAAEVPLHRVDEPWLSPPPKVPFEPVEQWRGRYPQAARVLDEWRAQYPRAASMLTVWEQRNPEQLETLVMWSVTEPHERLTSFLLTRSGWGELRAIAHAEPEAVEAFLHWARQSRLAAEELALHSGSALLSVTGR